MNFAKLACLSLLVIGCGASRTFAVDTSGGGGQGGATSSETTGSHTHASSTGATSDGGGGVGGSSGSGGAMACGPGHACDAGTCVDGFCCDRACDGTCEACNVAGHEGTCTAVTGTPVAPRAACAGAGTPCAGSCDGTQGDCSFPPNSPLCGAACDGKCDSGACNPVAGTTCPAGFTCAGNGVCGMTCDVPADCQAHFSCQAHACVRDAEVNCFDGMDDNGDGNADCADPSCADRVECVTNAGIELGVLAAIGDTCPDQFGTEETYHQDLQPQACTGCACETICRGTVLFYAGDNFCSGFASFTTQISSYPSQGLKCDPSGTSGTIRSMKLGALSAIGCQLGAGTATQPDPTWGSDSQFCATTPVTAGCGANQVCVAKPTAPLCVRVNEADACPAGFTGSNDVYFTDFTPGTCGSCQSCTQGATVQCAYGFLNPAVDTGACGTAGDFPPHDGSCDDNTDRSYQSINYAMTYANGDDCRVNFSNVSEPTATGATRICCQ